MSQFSFQCRTKTAFGRRALAHLPFDLAAMNGVKPMVIQDADANRAGLGKILANAFSDSGMTLGISPPLPATQGDEAVRFIRSMEELFRAKGYDCLVALGREGAADAAKALNMAATLGPEVLKTGVVGAPLAPLVYLPTGVRTGRASAACAEFNGRRFRSAYLAPDQVLLDPEIFIPDSRDTLIDSALTSLAAACEVFTRRRNPPARAYAETIIRLVMPCLADLLASGLAPPNDLKRGKTEETRWQKHLAQAAVLSGYLMNENGSIRSLGRTLSARGRISQGLAMILVLPGFLEYAPAADTAALLLPLAGPDAFCAAPAAQRPGAAVREIRHLVNQLHLLSRGVIARTLAEAGWSQAALTALARELRENDALPPDSDPAVIEEILCAAATGRSVAPQGPNGEKGGDHVRA
jgi:alcohol dehydrogenase class IV